MTNDLSSLQGDYSSLYKSPEDIFYSSGDDATDFFAALGFPSARDAVNNTVSEHSANNQLYRDLVKLNEQNIFNSAEAQKSRDFQERMSNTAYQRAVADMQKAGINPILAFQQGGSSAPSGASASSGSGSASGSNFKGSSSSSDILQGLLKVIAGLIPLL